MAALVAGGVTTELAGWGGGGRSAGAHGKQDKRATPRTARPSYPPWAAAAPQVPPPPPMNAATAAAVRHAVAALRRRRSTPPYDLHTASATGAGDGSNVWPGAIRYSKYVGQSIRVRVKRSVSIS